MPAVRDFAFGYESTTTNAGVDIPMCTHQTNDLLLVFAMADTGAGTWGCWSNFYAGAETVKSFNANTSTYTNETADANNATTNDVVPPPIQTTTVGDAIYFGNPQEFASLRITLGTAGNHSGITLQWQYYNGSWTALSGVTDGTTNFEAVAGTYTVTFTKPSDWVTFAVDSSTQYWVRCVVTAHATPTITTAPRITQAWLGYFQLFARNSTASIISYWRIAGPDESDIIITNTVNETYNGCVISIRDIDTASPFGSPTMLAETTQTGTRFQMGTVTTQRDHSLIIFHAASAGNNAGIHFVEEATHELLISDGAAEGQGVGWAYQKTTGVSTNVYCDSPVSNVTKAVIGINPPSGGATVIPPHVVADTSQYLDPNAAGVNFDSNTFMAATADTNFGTSIASKTCNDATVALSADIGINSFHGMMGLTNAATAQQISGANLVLAAARYNIGTRNVLAHFRHTTPAHNQRLTNLASDRGVWMGLRSGTTAAQNWKVWQVHGSDVPIIAGHIQPLVVNCGNTDTIATNGTLVNSDVRYVGFWTGGIGALTQQTCIGPMWALDTTTISSGNQTIGLPEVVDLVATKKERLSAILQGANQMLCLQKIQFGNGGTEPISLIVDSAAIEFPSKKNVAKKLVNYNGVDNSVGFIFYPGDDDTIKITSTVISSANRYSFGLHSSASTSAEYDFSGTSVIGAGTIALARAITINELTINNYSTLDISNCTLNNCTILGVPAANDTLTTNSSTNVDNSSISVTGVTAGNRWCSVADPTIFSGCTFTGSGSAGHAIRITSPGTYSFVGNTFTAFGSTGSNSAAIFNDSAGLVTLNISGTTSQPTYRNGTDASTSVVLSVDLEINIVDADGDAITANCEVTVVKVADESVLFHEDNITDGVTTYSFPAADAGTAVYINVLNVEADTNDIRYQNKTAYLSLPSTNTSTPIQLDEDRYYANPA
jgi:hypothetical protein